VQLIDAGAEPCAADRQGQTPLHRAAQHGAPDELLRLVLEASAAADVRQPDKAGRHPIALAAASGHAHAVNVLVHASADVSAPARDGQTPLHRAASAGAVPCVALLLGAAAAVDARDKSEETPLHKAASEGWHECVRQLLRAGADINASSVTGATPLHIAGKKSHSPAVVELLRRWPVTLVVDTPSSELAELMRSHSRMRLLAEDSVEGAIEAVCLPLVVRHLSGLPAARGAELLVSAPRAADLREHLNEAEVWFAVATHAGDLDAALSFAVWGNLTHSLQEAVETDSLPAPPAEGSNIVSSDESSGPGEEDADDDEGGGGGGGEGGGCGCGGGGGDPRPRSAPASKGANRVTSAGFAETRRALAECSADADRVEVRSRFCFCFFSFVAVCLCAWFRVVTLCSSPSTATSGVPTAPAPLLPQSPPSPLPFPPPQTPSSLSLRQYLVVLCPAPASHFYRHVLRVFHYF
jgi:ankyrin repeat protein